MSAVGTRRTLRSPEELKAANWHLFRAGGLSLFFDARTLSLNILDEVARRVAELYGLMSSDDIIGRLSPMYPLSDVESAIAEIEDLVSSGLVSDFRQDDRALFPIEFIPDEKASLPVKALCLNVAHDCNLRCRYCFASSGDFGGSRKLMPANVARQAIDFLLKSSGPRAHCEVDFFGGEPLVNWPVVVDAVRYGYQRSAEYSKALKFTVTTNATLLDDEKIEFIRSNNMDIVLSLDGRPETNDRMRIFADKRPSYEVVSRNIRRYLEHKGDGIYYVRGTYTSYNLDFAADVMHLADLGARSVSVEPVVAGPDEPYSIREEHLPRIYEEYDKLALQYVDRARNGRGFSFFHFNVDLDHGPCIAKRFSGCGAGIEYLAVTPEGDIYPCHQFVGKQDYRLGNVWDGILHPEISRQFAGAHIYTKNGCANCWARFLCGGGCHANAVERGGDILSPDNIACAIMRKRLETALFVKAALSSPQ